MRVESRTILVINRSRLVINSRDIGDRIAREHDYENIRSFYKQRARVDSIPKLDFHQNSLKQIIIMYGSTNGFVTRNDAS